MTTHIDDLGDRTQYIGGSDIAAILGISPWTKRDALLREKATGVHRDFNSPILDFGHKIEPRLIEGARLQFDFTDVEIAETVREFDGFTIHCHFDRVVKMPSGELVLIECKTSSDVPDCTPDYYKAQTMTYLHELNELQIVKESGGIKRVMMLWGQRDSTDDGYILGKVAEPYFDEYDPAWWGKIEPALAEFIKDIKEYVPSDNCLELTECKGKPVDYICDLLRQREQVEAQIKQFEDDLKTLLEIHGATSARFGEYTATLTKPTVRKSFDKESAKKDPDYKVYERITAEYIKETPVASGLRISKKKV